MSACNVDRFYDRWRLNVLRGDPYDTLLATFFPWPPQFPPPPKLTRQESPPMPTERFEQAEREVMREMREMLPTETKMGCGRDNEPASVLEGCLDQIKEECRIATEIRDKLLHLIGAVHAETRQEIQLQKENTVEKMPPDDEGPKLVTKAGNLDVLQLHIIELDSLNQESRCYLDKLALLVS